jgi:hypothetical protein
VNPTSSTCVPQQVGIGPGANPDPDPHANLNAQPNHNGHADAHQDSQTNANRYAEPKAGVDAHATAEITPPLALRRFRPFLSRAGPIEGSFGCVPALPMATPFGSKAGPAKAGLAV